VSIFIKKERYGKLKNKLPFSGDLWKTAFYACIKLHKPRHKKYVLGDIWSAYRHTVLRLPPFHPDLNAIDNIWGDVKQWAVKQYVAFKLDDVRQLCGQQFAVISDMEWGVVCCHVQNIENQYIPTEGLMEPEVERLIFSVSGSISSVDNLSYSESDSTTDIDS
jgi:hypothetical protein